eukprot:2742704-Prymnesium_polylepis.1
MTIAADMSAGPRHTRPRTQPHPRRRPPSDLSAQRAAALCAVSRDALRTYARATFPTRHVPYSYR